MREQVLYSYIYTKKALMQMQGSRTKTEEKKLAPPPDRKGGGGCGAMPSLLHVVLVTSLWSPAAFPIVSSCLVSGCGPCLHCCPHPMCFCFWCHALIPIVLPVP
jgi:hypothetical protein